MIHPAMLHFLGLCVIISPAALLAALGLPPLVGRRLGEQAIIRCLHAFMVIGCAASVAILGLMLATDQQSVTVEIGNWAEIDALHFQFHFKFIFDRLSVPFVILTYVLCGTIGKFTSRYLHRDPGFGRFCVCFAFFVLGMVFSSLAGTIEVLFLGWELVGLSSALLVAFFQRRLNPVRNGLQVWSVYRFADAAFLIAALTMHHLTGAGDFTGLMGVDAWPDGHATVTSHQALLVGLLLLVAAAGKSALVPFSGWLPRAMEGPTPSSAVFYGALSVHLGAFLLMRVSPLLALSLPLRLAVIGLGGATCLFAAITTRVQTDVKSGLAFASLTQVGIIVVEIGLGLDYIALIHLVGHASLRTLQLLRAPTLLRDYDMLENAIGSRLPQGPTFWEQVLPARARDVLYRLACERGYLDPLLDDYVAYPFRRVFQACDQWERRWTHFLSGRPTTGACRRSHDRTAAEEQHERTATAVD